MVATLLACGLACIVAGIVGGGLKAYQIEFPALESGRRQFALIFFGVLLLAVTLSAKLDTLEWIRQHIAAASAANREPPTAPAQPGEDHKDDANAGKGVARKDSGDSSQNLIGDDTVGAFLRIKQYGASIDPDFYRAGLDQSMSLLNITIDNKPQPLHFSVSLDGLTKPQYARLSRGEHQVVFEVKPLVRNDGAVFSVRKPTCTTTFEVTRFTDYINWTLTLTPAGAVHCDIESEFSLWRRVGGEPEAP